MAKATNDGINYKTWDGSNWWAACFGNKSLGRVAA